MKTLIKKIDKILISKYGLPKKNESGSDPVDTLIATILSQNTTDNNSYKAYQNLKSNFKNWNDVAEANLKTIEKNIRVGGLAKQKARSIKNILNQLGKKNGKVSLNYSSSIPNEEIIEHLIGFEGVGVKTASCVLLFSLKRNVCPVDTHVHRIANRLGLVNTKAPDKTFKKINENLPDDVAHSFHSNLIKLGRDICKAGKPLCASCPLIKLCKFEDKNMHIMKRKGLNNFLLLDNV